MELRARRLIEPQGAIARVTVSAVTGIVVFGLAEWRKLSLPLLLGWNVAGATMLFLAWVLITSCDEKETQARAGKEDPGRSVVYAIVLIASSVSLLAALQLTRRVGTLPPAEVGISELMCLVTVALAWGLTHTSFTLRYAHLYYREDDQGVGGVEFPGQCIPSYFDFAYFAFTIGMCFQTSDVSVTSSPIRRAVLLHAIISFAYNTAIIAFVLNLVFGKVS